MEFLCRQLPILFHFSNSIFKFFGFIPFLKISSSVDGILLVIELHSVCANFSACISAIFFYSNFLQVGYFSYNESKTLTLYYFPETLYILLGTVLLCIVGSFLKDSLAALKVLILSWFGSFLLFITILSHV